MRMRPILLLAILPALSGWGEHEPGWPYAGVMPDQPVAVPAVRYVPIGAGTRSYRPVEPMPWGDVNQRVAPPPKKSPTDMHEGH